MELARLVFEVPPFEPDLVVMYNGGNDLMHPWRFDPRPGYPFNFMVYENNPVLESDVRTYPALATAAYGSNILRAWFPNFFVERFVPQAALRSEAGWGSEAWADRIAACYVENVVRSDAIARCFGSDFMAFFQPTVFYKNPLDPGERKLVSRDGKAFMDLTRRLIFQRMDREPGSSRAGLVDLTAIFDGQPGRVFEDHIHLYAAANAAVARSIHDRIGSRPGTRRP
jgi:hypothetical protein